MRHLDPCADCDTGTMLKYCTRTKGHIRRRYLKCNGCGQCGQEVFRVDELGRQIFTSCLTPSGKNGLEFDASALTMNEAKQ